MALLMIGLTFIIAGLIMLIRNINLVKKGIPAKGIISGYETDNPSEQTGFYPIVTFTNSENEETSARLYKFPEKNKPYEIGSEVDILYHPHNPKKIIQNKALIIKGLPISIAAIGLIPLIVYILQLAGVIQE